MSTINYQLLILLSLSLSTITISHAPREPPYELVQGRQLLAVDQVKLLDEVDEVLQARVHVGLLPERHNLGSEIFCLRC